MTRRAAVLLAIAAAAMAAPATAAAAPAVTNTNDSGAGSLRASLAGAANGDTINVPAGTYTLTSGSLKITTGVTLQGAGAGITIIRQTIGDRVFEITPGANDVTLNGFIVTGGNVNGNGGAISYFGTGTLFVTLCIVQGNRASTSALSGGGGGGIFSSGGEVRLDRTTLRNNTATATGAGGQNGGGGLRVVGDSATLDNSTISGNTATVAGNQSGGGGIWAPTASIANSTVGGNTLTASGVASGSGGGGIFTLDGLANIIGSTVAGNSSQLPGGGLFNAGATADTLTNTIMAGNTAPSSASCAGSTTSGNNNLQSDNSCATGTGDQTNTDPRLDPLADYGGPTQTYRLQANSPAINAADTAQCFITDQRGVDRPVGGDCDIGAFEFDGLAIATVPDCSPTGQIPLGMTASPGEGVVAFVYKVDNGAEQSIPAAGGSQANTILDIPEGRRTLEYWGAYTNGEEFNHHLPQVLVDKTDPNVGIVSEQKRSIYVITRRASVDVNATDALSGLVGDPSANGERIGTGARGAQSVTKTATDLCGNQQTATLDYRVLGPGLGVRAVLERVRGRVKIRRPGSASAAQKGGGFVTLSQPREIPIRSLVDTRRGSIRLTSSRSASPTNIQDGVISAGLFQVLQSRKRASKGLTELRLKGSSFRRCRTTGKGASTSLSRRRIRRLRANVKGRFRTRGRFSAATVRGTDFTVTDRCDGTLTKVIRGRVAVRDFRRKRTVIVRAGKSYLAKAPVR